MQNLNSTKNIFLIGMMGSGKSAVGKQLAKILSVPFYDLDSEIENYFGKPIHQIFQTNGEAEFRKMEQSVPDFLKLPSDGCVVSTGGGFPINEKNFLWMRDNGVIVWLQASPETIIQRIGADSGRPLFEASKISQILDQRLFVYQQADVYIRTDGKKIEQVAQEILQGMKNQ
jgi:shikimate kinase